MKSDREFKHLVFHEFLEAFDKLHYEQPLDFQCSCWATSKGKNPTNT